jgi:hypothetical protein
VVRNIDLLSGIVFTQSLDERFCYFSRTEKWASEKRCFPIIYRALIA